MVISENSLFLSMNQEVSYFVSYNVYSKFLKANRIVGKLITWKSREREGKP